MNEWTTIAAPSVPTAVDPDVERDRKHRFAEALLRTPEDAFNAARSVFGTDTMGAMQAAWAWPNDLVVLQRQAELLEKLGPEEFLPAKHEVARRVWDISQVANDPKDRLNALKLYADLRGFMPKADTVINNTVNNNRVMIVRDFGTDEQWEQAAANQQAKLIEHSRD